MKAVPARIPDVWSPAWFRRFYVEVIARQALPVGALVLTETDPVEVYGFGDWSARGTDTIAGVAVTLYERIA